MTTKTNKKPRAKTKEVEQCPICEGKAEVKGGRIRRIFQHSPWCKTVAKGERAQLDYRNLRRTLYAIVLAGTLKYGFTEYAAAKRIATAIIQELLPPTKCLRSSTKKH